MLNPIKKRQLLLLLKVNQLSVRSIIIVVCGEHSVNGDAVRNSHLPHHFAGKLPKLLAVHIVLWGLIKLKVHGLLQKILEFIMQTVAK